jgi:hypothetical protein
MGTPFHQHLFDVTPLLEQELVLDPVGVIRARNFVGNVVIVEQTLFRKNTPDGRVILTSVVGHFSRNLAAPGALEAVHINGVLPIRSWAFGSAPPFRRSSTMSRSVVAPEVCSVQRRATLWDRYRVGVGTVFNKLLCKDELVFMG